MVTIEPTYFASPKEAVATISELARRRDWPALAGYYDLSGSTIELLTLLSGAFFVRSEQPAGAHPGGYWRARHPFPPGFDYLMAEPGGAPGVVTVTVHVSIEQGASASTQEGRAQFRLRESPRGYQILPD